MVHRKLSRLLLLISKRIFRTPVNCFLEIYFLCDCVCVWVGEGCVHITQCLWRSEEGTGFPTDEVREVVSYLTQELRNKCHPLHKHYPLLNSESYLSSPVTYSERNILSSKLILRTHMEKSLNCFNACFYYLTGS